MFKKLALGIFCSCIWLTLPAQEERGLVRQGNQRYIEGKWDEAEKEYNKALNVKNNLPESVFNLGDVAYQKQDFQKAASQFETAAMLATDNQQKAKAYHNLGNAYLEAKQYDKSIEAYKNALRNKPDDKEARENLQKALLELKKKNPPKKKEQDKKKKQEPQQQKQPQSRISPKEAEQRLKLLQQKEKQVQQRVQSERNKTGAGQKKDW